MKTIILGPLKAVFLGLVVSAASFMPNSGSCQSSTEPAVVISLAPLDEQLNDFDYLANAAGEQIGQMSGFLKMQATAFLRGIDQKRPIGALLYFREGAEEPSPVIYLPVKNLDDVLDTISQNVGADIDEGDKYVTLVLQNGQELFLKKNGNYAVISDNKELIDSAGGDPAEFLGGLEDFNFGARLFAQRIPQDLREQALGMIRMGAEGGIDEDGDEIQVELQRKNVEMQMKQMETLFNETEELVVGFVANEDDEAIRVVVNMTGKDGSELAERMQSAGKSGQSRFKGFLMDGSAFTANAVSKLAGADVENYKQMKGGMKDMIFEKIEESINEAAGEDDDDDAVASRNAQIEFFKKVINDLDDVMTQTLEDGRMDLGAALTTADGNLNFAMGAQVANPAKLESTLKELIKMAESEGELEGKVEFKLNASSHRGVVMHQATITVDEDQEEARNILGDTVQLVFGIGKKEVYVGFGHDPASLIKKAMDGSQGSSSDSSDMGQWNLYLAPILRFVSGIEGAEMVEVMADKMEEVGKDRIRVTSNVVKNGVRVQFEMQDGILQLLGVAGQVMGGMGGGADF